jgi:hypothetical protein
MLAVSHGRMICLSTPHGKRGFFYEYWSKGGDVWTRIEVPATQIPRITPEFLALERACLGESYFRQEYCCSFEALEGLVYPDLAHCVTPAPATLDFGPWTLDSSGQTKNPIPGSRLFGGIDFGFRNPFAAVWAVLDRDDLLWLFGEHYAREKPLSYHVRFLPKNVRWYADPAGASEIAELRHASFKISAGDNTIRAGIAAISARIESGTLKVIQGRCPNLLAEAQLYRYSDDPTDRRSETPLDQHNHALAALRYLISKLDARRMARLRNPSETSGLGVNLDSSHPAQHSEPSDQYLTGPNSRPTRKPWLRYDNEALWSRLW